MISSAQQPVLLVINTDNCPHCITLLDNRLAINTSVKAIDPSIRCVWVCLDSMQSGILPATLSVPYVPLVMYYPEGFWESCMQTGDFTNGYVMSISDMNIYTGSQSEKILNWLRDKIIKPSQSIDVMGPTGAYPRSVTGAPIHYKPCPNKYGSENEVKSTQVKSTQVGVDTTFWVMYKGIKFNVKCSLGNGVVVGIGCPEIGLETSFDMGKLLKLY